MPNCFRLISIKGNKKRFSSNLFVQGKHSHFYTFICNNTNYEVNSAIDFRKQTGTFCVITV